MRWLNTKAVFHRKFHEQDFLYEYENSFWANDKDIGYKEFLPVNLKVSHRNDIFLETKVPPNHETKQNLSQAQEKGYINQYISLLVFIPK